MRKTKFLQRVLALSLTCGMVLPALALNSVSAQEGLPVTRYATPEQALESFDTDSETADKIAKKVVFGKRCGRGSTGVVYRRERSCGRRYGAGKCSAL